MLGRGPDGPPFKGWRRCARGSGGAWILGSSALRSGWVRGGRSDGCAHVVAASMNVRCPFGCLSGFVSRETTASLAARQDAERTSVVDACHLQRSAGGRSRHVGWIAPPREEPRQSVERFGSVCAREPSDARPRQLVGAFLFVAGHLLEHRRSEARVDPPGSERRRHRPPPLHARAHGVLHEGTREGFVVDQTDPLEAGELGLDLLGLKPRREETPLELPAAPLAYRQEPERAFVAVPPAQDRSALTLAAGSSSSSSTRSGTISIGLSSASENAVSPTASRTRRSISSRRSSCSARNWRAFSRP
jgi:hypothetical protein